jgi:chromatin segregation and condensation protein Rec8/ScpA/Scc1 (kleisin family)
VLELFKQGIVDVVQIETFGDLVVRRLAEGEAVLDDAGLDDWEPTPRVSESV